jgi:puromycin-sensitive aminopeptidase
MGMSDGSRHRLPYTVSPRRYDLILEPDLATFRFAGEATIAVEVHEPVRSLVLNAADLEIDDATVAGRPARPVLDGATERLTLELDEAVPAGPAVVRLRFRGVINDELRGFYRSTATDERGTRTIAVTQFEAPHARRAFPCWDEPDRKAVFGITLVVADGLTAISNGVEIAVEPTGDGRRRVRFADTIPMSTYLVAFVVGELEATAPIDVDGVALRIVHVPGKGHLADYAAQVGVHALRWYADYFGIPYPGEKLDLIAVPDFAFGAMENLGAVVFREVLLLVDPAAVSRQELERVTDVICHEIAHMWFGDLVTMSWWNGIWLNEAFATFMEVHGTNAFRPDWRRWDEFSLARSAAFDVDALARTRPVEYPVETPADAEGMFDVLTYEKGGALVRMLEQYLEPPMFRDGIRRYVDTHRLGNTETADLWDALEAVSGAPARRIMDSWIYQPGFPEVRAELLDGGRLRLSQRRFAYAGADPLPPEAAETRWGVPVLVRTAATTHRVLLDGPEIVVDLGGATDPVVVNAGAFGFFRVTYADALREAVAAAARDALTSVERYTLVDDTWAGVLAASVPAPAFLDLSRTLASDDDPVVWRAILSGLAQLSWIVDGDDLDALRRFARTLVRPPLDALGWAPGAGESDDVRSLRGLLIAAAGGLGADPDVRSRARDVLQQALRDPGSVDQEVYAAVVAVVAASGSPAEFELYVDRWHHATTPQEEQRFLYALGDFPQPDLVRRVVDLAFGDQVRPQNAPLLLARALANRTCGLVAWGAVSGHWDDLVERFAPALVARNIFGAVRWYTDTDVVADIRRAVEARPLPAAMRTVEQHLERQRVGLALRVREAARLAATLRTS